MEERVRAWLTRNPLPLASAAVSACLAWWIIGAVLAKLGHPGATLDDTYIHFQYARSIAEGHPLRFQADAPISTGGTSWLWPAVLAPFYLVGFRDLAILWPAWLLSFAALAMLAVEVYHLTKPLAGSAAAFAAGAMVPAFGGLVWCAASGMEAVPFAWAITGCVRRASEWAEGRRDRRPLIELVGFSWLAELLRPEGGAFALLACVTLLAFPRPPRESASKGARWALRAGTALLPLAMPLLVTWTLQLVSGSALATTAHVKLLPGNPYYRGPMLVAAVTENVKLLIGTLLNGQIWSAIFLPRTETLGAVVAICGLGTIVIQGVRTGRRWRALLALSLALGMFIPCFYYSFLWNRLRYLWPFAGGWFVGLACLARIAGDGLGRVRSRWRLATPIVAGCFVGLFASRLADTRADVAQSASGIDRQQVKLGRWAKANLPPSARIGLNDTGAIAYFGERRTFDVVGLTTASEVPYWVAGPGSRFEHYERLAKRDPGALPTHFIVYPQWMACDAVLGTELTEAVVTDSTILGGTTMGAYVADWSLLGSGEQPWTALPSGVHDASDSLDVADLESEAEHDYTLAWARNGENTARMADAPDGHTVADGGRTNRHIERFTLRHLQEGKGAFVVARIESQSPNILRINANGHELPPVAVEGGDTWTEVRFDVPPDAARAQTAIEIEAVKPFTSYHYWAFVGP